MTAERPLTLLSVVIPARDEERCIAETVAALCAELRGQAIPCEIVVVDDGSSDRTFAVLQQLSKHWPEVRPVRNEGEHGFGRAVIFGLERMRGDAVVITMADGSDDCRDVARYWRELQRGADCVFGSRFIPGGRVTGYPPLKLVLNRLANCFLRGLFRHGFNDTTNAFKAYRREVIDGCRPLLSPHFNLTVELPLKAMVRGYRWSVIPVSWRGRQSGTSKLKIKEMGSRYLGISLRIWLEKLLTRRAYRRVQGQVAEPPKSARER